MSAYVSVAGLQPRQIWDGVVARPLHGERITIGILEFEPLTLVPEHRHANEQLGLVLKGSITMVIDGERRQLQMGAMYAISPLVNSAPHFTEPHVVADGASELFLEIFGERGAHARSAFGVAQIPFGSCVEIELIAEVSDPVTQ